MIIAMSSTGKEPGAQVDSRFGRCAYFAFYNTEENSWRFFDNPGVLEGSGAGIKAAQFVIEKKAGVVLTGETGPKATRVLQAAGIDVQFVSNVSLQEALERFTGAKQPVEDTSTVDPPEPEEKSGQNPAPSQGETGIFHGKIAIATEGSQVAPHFGRCSGYTVVKVQDGKAIDRGIIPNPGHQPGLLPRYLGEMGVDWVIAGGMGMRAQNLFAEQGILTVIGVTGTVDTALQDFLSGKLAGGESLCSHPYEHGHGDCEGH